MKIPQKKILIAGSHRSGTTWLWQILKAGNCLSALSEPFNKEGKYTDRFTFDCWFPYLAPDERHAEVVEALDYSLNIEKKSPRNLIMNRLRKGRPFCLIKDPTGLFASEWYYRQYETDNIILIRHPAAFVFSIMRVKWWHPFDDFQPGRNLPPIVEERYWVDIQSEARQRGDIVRHAALLWTVLYAYVEKLSQRYQDNPRWHFVRHEDLSMNPEHEISMLIRKLGLRETPRQKNRIEELCYGKEQVDLHTKKVHVMKRDSRKITKKWKEILSAEQIDVIRNVSQQVWPGFYGEEEW